MHKLHWLLARVHSPISSTLLQGHWTSSSPFPHLINFLSSAYYSLYYAFCPFTYFKNLNSNSTFLSSSCYTFSLPNVAKTLPKSYLKYIYIQFYSLLIPILVSFLFSLPYQNLAYKGHQGPHDTQRSLCLISRQPWTCQSPPSVW